MAIFAETDSLESRRRSNYILGAIRYVVGYDIFISYSRHDATEYARALYRRLSALNFLCFLDEQEIAAGSALRHSLLRALRRSSVLVIVGSPGAFASRYVELEVI